MEGDLYQLLEYNAGLLEKLQDPGNYSDAAILQVASDSVVGVNDKIQTVIIQEHSLMIIADQLRNL